MRAVGTALAILGFLGVLAGLVLMVVFMFVVAARPGANPDLVNLVGASFGLVLIAALVTAAGILLEYVAEDAS